MTEGEDFKHEANLYQSHADKPSERRDDPSVMKLVSVSFTIPHSDIQKEKTYTHAGLEWRDILISRNITFGGALMLFSIMHNDEVLEVVDVDYMSHLDT